MSTLNFKEPSELIGWLDTLSEPFPVYLFDFVEALVPPPTQGATEVDCPKSISFNLGSCTLGRFGAGQECVYQIRRVTGQGVSRWNLREPSDLAVLKIPDAITLKVDETSDRIDLVINDSLVLSCDSLSIEQLESESRWNKPNLSNRYATIEFVQPALYPADWLSVFATAGVDVSWRRLGDCSVPPNEVPQTDYVGWFLQENSRIAETSHGLMVGYLGLKGDVFKITFEFWNNENGEQGPPTLWHGLTKVAAVLPESKVTCGNCILYGVEWQNATELGTPYLESLDFGSRFPTSDKHWCGVHKIFHDNESEF